MTALSTITPALNTRIATNSVLTAVFDAVLLGSSVNKQNIIFETDGSPVDYTISNSPTTTIVVTPTAILSPETIYELTFTASILDYLSSPITPVTLKFITETEETYNEQVSENLGKNHLDMFNTNLNETNKLLDVDWMMSNLGDNLNFSYNPTAFDPDTKVYEKDKTVVIDFDIQTLFKEKFQGQYLDGLTGYLEKITELNVLPASEFNDIERFIYTNAFEIAISSGTKTQIESLMKIYGQTINRNFIDVQADINDPFVYHIVTNIETEHWNGILKDLLHPISWQEKYRRLPDYTFMGVELSEFTVNVTNDYLTFTPRTIADETPVIFESTIAIPAGLETGVTYYVVNTSSNTFQVSPEIDGDAVTITDIGSGVLTCYDDENNNYKISALLSGSIFTLTTPTILDDTNVHIDTSDTLPLGLENNTTYYVVDSAGTYFRLSALEGGDSIEIRDEGIGTHTIHKLQYAQTDLYDWKISDFDNFVDDNDLDDILVVRNATRFFDRWVMPYTRAFALGVALNATRFEENVEDQTTLGVIFHIDSTYVWTVGDTTFGVEDTWTGSFYKNLVYHTSTSFLTTTFSIGGVVLYNEEYHITGAMGTTDYDIDTTTNSPGLTINANYPSYVDIQCDFDISTIPDLTTIGEILLLESDGSTICEISSVDVPPLLIKDYDYSTNYITVDPDGDDIINALDNPAVHFNYGTPDVKKVITWYYPGIVSADVNLWYGYSYMFILGYIDIKDYEDWMEFRIKYTTKDSTIELPVDSDTNFTNTLSLSALFDTLEEGGTFKQYTYTQVGNAPVWKSGHYIYEYDDASDIIGTKIGAIEYYDSSDDATDMIIKFYDPDDYIKSEKYYWYEPGYHWLIDPADDHIAEGAWWTFDSADQSFTWDTTTSPNANTTNSSGTALHKSGGTPDTWDAGATSDTTYASSDYRLEISVSETTCRRAIGFTNTNPDNNYTGIDFALYFNEDNNTVDVYENGDVKATVVFTGFFGDNLFVIEVINDTVRYYANNGTQLLYESSATPTWPMYVDCSIYTSTNVAFGSVGLDELTYDNWTNKISVQYNHPTFEDYTWTVKPQSGLTYVAISRNYDNTLEFLAEGAILYDIDLELDWERIDETAHNLVMTDVLTGLNS